MLQDRDRLSARMSGLTLAPGPVTIGHLALLHAATQPEHESVVFPDRRITYAELAARSLDVAAGLLELGVQPGDHVGFYMGNNPDIVSCFFGIALAGAVVVPINARYVPTELREILEDSDVSVLLTHDAADEYVDLSQRLHEAVPGLADADCDGELALDSHPALRRVVMMGQRQSAGMMTRGAFEELSERSDDAQLQTRIEGVRLRDVGLMLYTSGTTSLPRGVMLSHEAFVRMWMSTGRVFRTVPEDRHYTSLPLYHVAALGCLTWVIGHGATFFSDYHVKASRMLTTLVDERITQFYPAYQPVMEALLEEPGFDDADLSALQVFLNVAPPEVLAQFQARLPDAIQLTTYGATEGGPVTISRIDDPLLDRIESCGPAQPGIELRITGDGGRQLPVGEIGEIEFRGFNTLSGYYKSPEKNAETFRAGGWVGVGDLGVLDDRGQVLFVGRKKETLKVGGENVAPQEIEAQLCAHPAVKLAQVVGIPDDALVEVPGAYVELYENAVFSEAELIAHCRGRLASFKVPRVVRPIDGADWPMSLTKIQRSEVRTLLLDELGIAAR